MASEVYTRLPLEIRHLIYDFCIEGSYDNEVIVRHSPRSRATFALLIRQSSGSHSYQWVEDRIHSVVRAELLGLEVAREMLESYFWTRTFKFSHRELDLLETFLNTDNTGLGRVPAEYAGRLHIHIRPFACAEPRAPEARRLEEQKCCRAIEALGAIKTTRTEVVVQFDLDRDSMDDYDYERNSEATGALLLQLVQATNNLREKGLRIETRFSGFWDEKQKARTRGGSICSLESCVAEMKRSLHQTYFEEPS